MINSNSHNKSVNKASKHLERSVKLHKKSIEHHTKAMDAMKEIIKGNKIEANGEKKMKKHLLGMKKK